MNGVTWMAYIRFDDARWTLLSSRTWSCGIRRRRFHLLFRPTREENFVSWPLRRYGMCYESPFCISIGVCWLWCHGCRQICLLLSSSIVMYLYESDSIPMRNGFGFGFAPVQTYEKKVRVWNIREVLWFLLLTYVIELKKRLGFNGRT